MIETILAKIPFYLTILSTACGAITAALIGGMAIWTFRDIRSRSRDVLAQLLATLLVLVLPIIGLIVYLMLRPRETLADAYERSLEQEALLQAIEEPEVCPGCGQRVKSDYLFCPTCHTRLKRACPACDRPLNLRWSLCPYCGAGVSPQVLETGARTIPYVREVQEVAGELEAGG
ncbi:MAG: zinc ribbon domain-containing protein [Anaerolineae bacterium]|nr:zinc ribbon domain-containing protein [Anaerolineae bacterium]